jgi:hypothetical protein
MKNNVKTSFYAFPLLLVIIVLIANGCQRPRPLAEPGPEPGLFSGKAGEFVFGDRRKKRRKRR